MERLDRSGRMDACTSSRAGAVDLVLTCKTVGERKRASIGRRSRPRAQAAGAGTELFFLSKENLFHRALDCWENAVLTSRFRACQPWHESCILSLTLSETGVDEIH